MNGVLGALRAPRAKKVSKLKPFWRARAARPGPLSPQGPLSKESVLEAFSVGGGGIKWPVQHRFCFFRGFTWTGHFIEAFSVGGGGIKWPFQHRFSFFRGFTWTGHFIEAFSVGGGGIKWPVQHRLFFFRGFTWTGHFIEAFSVGGGGIKWPVQHRFCFFRGFTWTGHFIEAFSVGEGGIRWPVQHRFCFTIDSVNDFDIDICLAVGFVPFRSHSKSFGFPIDEIDDIPPKFERGPSTL